MRLCVDVEMIWPAGVGNLRSLQELYLYYGSIDDYEDFAVEVGRLTELRILTFLVNKKIDEGVWKALLESLCGLSRIQNLVIWMSPWEPPRQLRKFCVFSVWLPWLPAWVNSMCVPQLSELFLRVSAMEARDLDILARLPPLRFLCLYVKQRFSWTVAGGGLFPNLRSCQKNIALTFLQGAMPMLMELWFWSRVSEDGAAKDVGLENLPLLNAIDIWLKCEGATARQVEEAEVTWRLAVHAHPNRPSIDVNRLREFLMKKEEDDGNDGKKISDTDHGNDDAGEISATTDQVPDSGAAQVDEEAKLAPILNNSLLHSFVRSCVQQQQEEKNFRDIVWRQPPL